MHSLHRKHLWITNWYAAILLLLLLYLSLSITNSVITPVIIFLNDHHRDTCGAEESALIGWPAQTANQRDLGRGTSRLQGHPLHPRRVANTLLARQEKWAVYISLSINIFLPQCSYLLLSCSFSNSTPLYLHQLTQKPANIHGSELPTFENLCSARSPVSFAS